MLSDLQLAKAVLMDEGATPEDAVSLLVNSPEMVERLMPLIDRKRDEIEAEIEQAEREAWEATPEGRLEAGRLAREAEAAEAEATANARALLRSEGVDDSSFTDVEARRASGVEVTPWAEIASNKELDAAVEEFAIAYDQLTDVERNTGHSALGVSKAAVAMFREGHGYSVAGLGLEPETWSLDTGLSAGAGAEGGGGESA